jgi:tetratricopeptide (TPR) repeat protein
VVDYGLIDARTTLANYYMNINFHCDAKEAVEPILDLAVTLNYRKRLPVIYTAMGSYYLYVEEDSHKGLEFIDKATAIAEEVADYLSWWGALFLSGTFLYMISEFQDAHKRLKQSLDFILLANNPMGIACSKGCISTCYQLEGKMNPAHEFAQETLTLAKETGDAYIKGMAYSCYSMSCYNKGLFDEAKTHLIEWATSYEKSAPVSWIIWTYGHWGSMHLDLREYDDAVNCFIKGIELTKKFSFLPSAIKLFQSGLVRAKVLRHDRDIELGELFACYQNYKITLGKGWIARNIGDILLHIDDDHLSDAGVWFKKAIEADTRNGFRWQLATDHALYSEWFKKKGDIQGTKEQLTQAIDLFRECGADGWVTRTEQELAAIS